MTKFSFNEVNYYIIYWGLKPNELRTSIDQPTRGWGSLLTTPTPNNYECSKHREEFNLPNLQLMNQIVAMVTEKNWSLSSIGTLTSTAVRMKSSRMKTRLPAIRTASDILQQQNSQWKTKLQVNDSTESTGANALVPKAITDLW